MPGLPDYQSVLDPGFRSIHEFPKYFDRLLQRLHYFFFIQQLDMI